MILHEENNDQFNYNVDESEGNRPSAVRYTVGGAPNVPESRQSLSTRNTLTNAGVTPLMMAVHCGEMQIIFACVSAGANPFLKDGLERTAWDYAAYFPKKNLGVDI